MPEPTANAQASGVQPRTLNDLRGELFEPSMDTNQIEQTADSLMDAIVRRDQNEYDPISGERLPEDAIAARRARSEQQPKGEKPEAAKPEGEKPEGEQEQEAKPEGEEQKPAEGEEEGEQYESLDDYLAKSKIDAESFKELPVTVTVDGKPQQVTLGELIKGHELKQASYDRMQQAARAREEFTTEQTQVRQALGVQIQRTEALITAAKQQLMGDYSGITQQQLNELRVNQPGAYADFMAEYRGRVDAINNLISQADTARQEQARAAQEQQRASVQTGMQKLLEARPEWSDPAKAKAAQVAMNAVAKKFGFTDAELNSIYDYRYMLVLDLAAQALQLQASKSTALKRVRSAPRMAKPGTRTTTDSRVSRYSQDRDRALKNPTDDNLAAAFEHFA